MKHKICLLLIFVVTAGCHTSNTNKNPGYLFPDVLPVDSANKMLGSYLNSIDYLHNDTDVQSVIFNAALLRQYLDSFTGSSNIAYIKIMFAHKLSYINAGGANKYAGFNNAALTLLIAGYDNSGNYIYYPTNQVIDNGMLCPPNCPSGPAGAPLLPVPNKNR